jgi:hypothetical protein
MLRHHPRLLGGLLLTAALVVSGGVGHAAPEDALMPLERYTTLKGKSLASTYRTRLLQFSEQIYHCMPWLDVHRGELGFKRTPGSEDDDRYLATWVYVDQREDASFSALPQERRVSAMFSRYGVDMLRRLSALADVVADSDVVGLSVALTWLKPGTGSRPGSQAVNETFSLFIDKATALDFLAKRVSAEEFLNRAKFNLFDGQDRVGRVPIEIWEDSFNSTYKASNYEPPRGATCP